MTDRPRILVADDDKLIQSAFSELLESSGYTVIQAWDGDEALAVAQREPPDLILLDIMMPKRNGIQVARDLKLNPATRGIPIIMVTALSGAPGAQLTRAEVYLKKPVRPGDLLEHVRRVLAAWGSPPAVPDGLGPARASPVPGS